MIQAPNDHDLVINLDGPDGNAFALMAYAKQFARDMGYASDEVILNNMMAGDYKNLVRTFDHYFGTFVILETTDEELLNAS
tara:strand:+ start:144 stop:386 length:243 start_codon:yes stop_codon:yes gene_type:complete